MYSELKLFSLKADTIAFDPEEAAQSLKEACRRNRRFWEVTGVSGNGRGDVLFALASAEADTTERFYFSRFPECEPEEIASEIRVRFQAGMLFLGSFLRNGELWGVYRRPAE